MSGRFHVALVALALEGLMPPRTAPPAAAANNTASAGDPAEAATATTPATAAPIAPPTPLVRPALAAAAAADASHRRSPLDPETAANKALFDRIQERTFRFFWDGANQASGMALEGSGTAQGHGPNLVTVGGSGFGVAAIIVAASRGWVDRSAAAERILKIARFLELAHVVNDPVGHQGYHGAWSHWLSADPAHFAKTVPFSGRDDGGDLVETALMIQGLLLAQSYFDADDALEAQLRQAIGGLWERVDWRWYASSGDGLLRWHWSPTHGFWRPADPIGRGWNEALAVYVLGAAAPLAPRRLSRDVYQATWVDPRFGVEHLVAGYRFRLPLAVGGPLFFAHYSFIGLDPRLMQDDYDFYWRHNVAHALSNRAYALDAAPRAHRYGPDVWGLTASQGPPSSDASSEPSYGPWAPTPGPDTGTVAPTAALSSFPYTPYYSMRALRWLAERADPRLSSGPFGFYDAFNLSRDWYSTEYLAIDQGPIVCMMENYRSGLLWRLMSSRADVRAGLERLGIHPPVHDTGFPLAVPEAKSGAVELIKHIETGTYQLEIHIKEPGRCTLTVAAADGSTAVTLWSDRPMPSGACTAELDHGLPQGRYEATLACSSAPKRVTLPIILR